MKKTMLILSALAAFTVPMAATAEDWYVVRNSDNKCAKDVGPANFIKIMQDLKQPYRADDTVRNGKIVKTVVIDSEAGIAITYYRGQQECLFAQQQRQAQQNRELDKYR